jgi:hypothetical protein
VAWPNHARLGQPLPSDDPIHQTTSGPSQGSSAILKPMVSWNVDKPWEKQPFDYETSPDLPGVSPDITWALFQDFLAQKAPRSVKSLAARGILSWTQLDLVAWSRAWELRARHYDNYLDRLRQETIEREIQEDAKAVARRHLATSKKIMTLVNLEVDKLLDMSRQSGLPALSKPQDVVRFFREGVKTERLVLGEATDVVESRINLDNLTLDELRQLRALQQKAGLE